MKATINPGGRLRDLPKCQINIPGMQNTITLRILPEITDTKSASYRDEPVIGRSFPIKTYSHSENRTITMKARFVILTRQDATNNMIALRGLQSAVYPRSGAVTVGGSIIPTLGAPPLQIFVTNPYVPPPICRIQCGNLLTGAKAATGDGWLCVVLRQYTVQYPTDVAWYSNNEGNGTYLPYKFDVDLTWDVVYANENLPGQELIMNDF